MCALKDMINIVSVVPLDQMSFLKGHFNEFCFKSLVLSLTIRDRKTCSILYLSLITPYPHSSCFSSNHPQCSSSPSLSSSSLCSPLKILFSHPPLFSLSNLLHPACLGWSTWSDFLSMARTKPFLCKCFHAAEHVTKHMWVETQSFRNPPEIKKSVILYYSYLEKSCIITRLLFSCCVLMYIK